MINKHLDITYNKEYLLILPSISKAFLDGFEFSFGNVFYAEKFSDYDDLNELLLKSNFKQLIFVDFNEEYIKIINSLKKDYIIKFIYTGSLGSLSLPLNYSVFNTIIKLYKNNQIDSIGLLDKSLFEVLKNKEYKLFFLSLDISVEDNINLNNQNTIGLLNDQDNPNHSFYNSLSAVKLTNYVASLYNINKATKNFCKTFKISYKNYKKEMLDNKVNLYVNFTENNYLYFFKSMDRNVPCILGNNTLINDNKILSQYLMVNSDDDINEIADKINQVISNKDVIMKEYKKFRSNYRMESSKSIESFLETNVDKNEIREDYDYLISVIVPVYNTEKYLENSLKSIIYSIPKKTEVLVINDGSTDNSEKIILKYVKKYPNIIKYIKQTNHGLGNVRNVGLKHAKGKYIASIDSDDTINPMFFHSALKYLKQDIDMVICDWLSVTDNDNYMTAAVDWVFNKENVYEGLLYTTIMPSTCNKIIKKSLYDELNIKFIEDKYEDLSTNPFIMLKAKTIKYINKPYYEYYIRSGSLMRTSAGYSMINILKIVYERLEKYKNLINVDIDKFKYYTFSWRIEEFIFNQLYTIDKDSLDEYIKYIYDNLYDITNEIFENRYYINMLDNLKNKENKDYILERNKAFKNKKLKQFILENSNNIFKLTPPIIYYGE